VLEAPASVKRKAQNRQFTRRIGFVTESRPVFADLPPHQLRLTVTGLRAFQVWHSLEWTRGDLAFTEKGKPKEDYEFA
jgi:hypothetical protein